MLEGFKIRFVPNGDAYIHSLEHLGNGLKRKLKTNWYKISRETSPSTRWKAVRLGSSSDRWGSCPPETGGVGVVVSPIEGVARISDAPTCNRDAIPVESNSSTVSLHDHIS